MAKGTLEFLSKDEIRKIHVTSLRVLEQVGVAVHSKGVSEALVGAGAVKSADGKRILIQEEIVTSSLSSAPKSILLASRNGEGDMRIPSDRLYAANGGEGIYIKDMVSGASRSPVQDDLRDFAILVDQFPQIDFFWPMVGALDQPTHLKGLQELRTCLEFTTKHVQSGALDAVEAERLLELASVLTEGPESLAKRPIFSAVQCPISPLTFDKDLAEAQVVFAKAGIPVVSMSASIAGMTSPVTLAGTLVQVNAENLASLVITQTARRGAPWVYSSDASPGNLRTGSIDYEALEAPLLRTGAGQMGRFYGLPVMTAGVALEDTSPLIGRISEGVPYMVTQMLVPSDLSSGFGGVGEAAGASFEQLVVDAWVWNAAREFIRQFSFDDASISFETIREAGVDGNFLGKRHTLSRFKTEFAATEKPDAKFSGAGEMRKPRALLKKARQEVSRILRAPKTPVVTRQESAAMLAVIKKYK